MEISRSVAEKALESDGEDEVFHSIFTPEFKAKPASRKRAAKRRGPRQPHERWAYFAWEWVFFLCFLVALWNIQHSFLLRLVCGILLVFPVPLLLIVSGQRLARLLFGRKSHNKKRRFHHLLHRYQRKGEEAMRNKDLLVFWRASLIGSTFSIISHALVAVSSFFLFEDMDGLDGLVKKTLPFLFIVCMLSTMATRLWKLAEGEDFGILVQIKRA